MVRNLQLLFIMVGIMWLTLTGAIGASAANNNGAAEPNEQALEGAEAVAPPAATIGSRVRLVALIDAGGAILRSAGVSKVTHPSAGIYCIKPIGTWDISKVVPSVTPEAGFSNGDSLLAYYYSGAAECPAKYIEVKTFNFSTGTSQLADNVAFTIVVP